MFGEGEGRSTRLDRAGCGEGRGKGVGKTVAWPGHGSPVIIDDHTASETPPHVQPQERELHAMYV